MNQQERLFQAIGEADPYLIARSEKQRRSRRPAYCLAAAACLALVLAAGSVLSQRTGPVTAPPHGEAPPVGDAAETPPHDAGGPDEGSSPCRPTAGISGACAC